MTKREEVVAAARWCLGTPYHHMGRLPKVGIDCAGVVIYAGRTAGCLAVDFEVPPYVQAAEGHMLEPYCDKHLGWRVAREDLRPADVVLIWVDIRAQHMGIDGDYVHGGLSLIHAFARRGPTRAMRGKVIETRLTFDRFAAAYRMPGL